MSTTSTYTATDGAGYEQMMGRWSRRLAPVFLQFTGIANGERVLDLGCGTGHLAAAMLRVSQPARVDGVDAAESYVAHAKSQYPDPRLDFRVGDACALDYTAGTFDRVLSLLMLHFVPQPALAIAEMRRVAKPGAVVAAAVWDARGGMVAHRMMLDTAAAIDSGAAELRARSLTRPMTRPGELAAAWRAAGLRDVAETSLQVRMEFAAFADFWEPFTGKEGPIAAYIGSLGGELRSRVEAAVRAAYLDGEPDGPRSYAALAFAVKGVAA
jgi:SAM-dependent methyltransferase